MTFYEIDKEDEELIKIALSKLESNFDDKKYNHTVGAVAGKGGNKRFTSICMFVEELYYSITKVIIKYGTEEKTDR